MNQLALAVYQYEVGYGEQVLCEESTQQPLLKSIKFLLDMPVKTITKILDDNGPLVQWG